MCTDILKEQINAAEEFKDTVEGLLETEQGSVDRVVLLIKTREYDSNRAQAT
jgi:hypothetical protein